VYDLASLKLTQTIPIDMTFTESTLGFRNEFYILFSQGLAKIDSELNTITKKFLFPPKDAAKTTLWWNRFFYTLLQSATKKKQATFLISNSN
jgi:hypothetical protein